MTPDPSKIGRRAAHRPKTASTVSEESVPAKPLDRRVRRTHRRLKEALLELIEERDYERVTIEDITERADVARSTFYSHFSSKEELLFSGFDTWVLGLAEGDSGVEEEAPRRDDRFHFSLPLLRHIATQGRFVRALLLASDGRLRRRVTELLAEVMRRELAAREKRDRAAPELRGGGPGRGGTLLDAQASMLAAAFLGLAAWWLAEGKGLGAEAVDAIFQRTIGPAA